MTRRQVFGLTGGGLVVPRWPCLLASLPGSFEECRESFPDGTSAVDAFVPDYRCGAVPDFNRVPSCDAWNAGEPTQYTALYGCAPLAVKVKRPFS